MVKIPWKYIGIGLLLILILYLIFGHTGQSILSAPIPQGYGTSGGG